MSQALVDDAFADLAREQAATDVVLAEHLYLGERVGEDGIAVRELWLSICRQSSQRCVEYANQLPDTSTTRRCARVALQDLRYDGRRQNPGLRDLVESDGGIVSGGEFERSCGMSGRSEDVLDLSSFWQRVEERRTHRLAGRARSVARSSLSRIAGLLSRPVGRPRAVP